MGPSGAPWVPWLRSFSHGFPHDFQPLDFRQGWVMLKDKIQKGGPLVLWAGWEGNYMANVVGNYPWFATMNVLQKHVTWRRIEDGALAGEP